MLTKFNLIKQLNYVNIQWTVQHEQNLHRYEIQRSNDRVHFITISTQYKGSSTNGNKEYFTTDYTPKKGINYYRIKSVDVDEKFIFSEIKKVEFETISSASVFPNPAQKEITINFPSCNQLVSSATIKNLAGQSVIKNIQLNKVNTSINIDHLSKGMYFISIIDELSGKKLQELTFIK